MDNFYLSLLKEAVEDRKSPLWNNSFVGRLENLKMTLSEAINKKVRHARLSRPFFDFIMVQEQAGYITVEKLFRKFLEIEDTEKIDKNKYGNLEYDLNQLAANGVVLYYRYHESLKNVVWPCPANTVQYIHDHILPKDKMQEEHGVIAKEKFEKLCSDEKIIEMLRLEKVIFYDEKNRQGARYIVPGYLRLSSPDDQNYQLHIAQHSKPCFVLKFRYFIPFGLINQLICLYGGNPDAKAFWRDQIVFTYQSKFGVWIKLDFSQLTISVYINPLREESKSDLPKTARTIFLDIIDLYHDTKRDDRSSIDYPEDMYISVDGKFFIDPTNLNNTRSSTIPAYTLDKAGNLKKNPGGDTQEVELYRIFSNNNNIKSMNKKIFISFSSIDEKYKDEFIKHTKGLQDNRLIEKPFVCSNIELGADWDATIKKEIDECDIMVCLVSVDFLNSDYCRRIEVKKAMEQGKKLISIIIRPCDWETSDFARFQAAYKGKCISLSSQNPLAENSGIEREACWTAIVKEMRKETFQ